MDFRVQLAVRLRAPYMMVSQEKRKRWRWFGAMSIKEVKQRITGYWIVIMVRADNIAEALAIAQRAAILPQGDLDKAAVDGEVEEAEIEKMNSADLMGDVSRAAEEASEHSAYYLTGRAFFEHKRGK